MSENHAPDFKQILDSLYVLRHYQKVPSKVMCFVVHRCCCRASRQGEQTQHSQQASGTVRKRSALVRLTRPNSRVGVEKNNIKLQINSMRLSLNPRKRLSFGHINILNWGAHPFIGGSPPSVSRKMELCMYTASLP